METGGKLYLSMAFMLAGTSVVAASFVSGILGPFTIITVSLGLLLIALGPFYAVKLWDGMRLMSFDNWKMILVQSVFGIFGFRIFLLTGLKYTSTGEAGILTGVTPAITALLAFLFLKEPLSLKAIQGIACTVAGVLLLQGLTADGNSFSVYHLGGNLLILCAAASESIFNVTSRKQRRKGEGESRLLHPMVQTILVAASAFFLCLIPALLEKPVTALSGIGFKEWFALIWYGLFVTALAFMFWYTGIRRCTAYTAAAFSGMAPLTALILSLVILGERIELGQWAGGLLIVLGMISIGRAPNRNSAGQPF